MVAPRWLILFLGALLFASIVLSRESRAARQLEVQQSGQVVEIRFGVIDPPIVAQRDITVRAPKSNQELEERALECSGLAWIPGGVLILSDRHSHIVFHSSIDLDHMVISDPVPHIVVPNEQQLLEDAECITAGRDADGRLMAYAICSLSNDSLGQPLPKRRHMLRFRVLGNDPLTLRRPTALSAASLRDLINDYFQAVGIETYRTFNIDFPGLDKNTYRWGNVEGMTFTPDRSAMLLGMRNPLCGNSAIFVVVQGVDQAFDTVDPEKMRISDMFALDLGGRGVSDLCWDPLTKGYLIAAAKSSGPKLDKDQPFPPNTLDSALFWWSGRKEAKAILFARMPDMKVEAICRLGATRFIAVGTDEGDVSEGRIRQQQSVLTILYFAGLDIAGDT